VYICQYTSLWYDKCMPIINESRIDLQQGFYVDIDTNRTFYVKRVSSKLVLVPPFVKSTMEKWRKIKKDGDKT
jgi:hypothetical protein